MKMNFVIFILSGILALLSGCKRPPAEVATSGNLQQAVKSPVLNREALARELAVGATHEQVIEILGEPDSEIALDETHHRLDYFYKTPTNSKNREDAITGVTIFLERGALLRWSPILGPLEIIQKPIDSEKSMPPGRVNPAGIDLPALQYWVLSDTPLAKGRYVDTPRFSKLGYIGTTAALTISNLISSRPGKEIIKGDGTFGDLTNYIVNLEFSRADAERFTQLCQDNLGRSVFITVGDLEIGSHRLRSVISSQNLVLPVENEALLIEVQQRLNRLVPTK